MAFRKQCVSHHFSEKFNGIGLSIFVFVFVQPPVLHHNHRKSQSMEQCFKIKKVPVCCDEYSIKDEAIEKSYKQLPTHTYENN